MVQRINFEGKSYVNCGGILLPEFESKPRAQKAPKVTALTVVPKQELPSMADLLKRQYGATNNFGLEFNNLANTNNVFGGTTAPSTPVGKKPIGLLGYTPSRTINAFDINGKYFLLENGKTIGCFDKFDKADWTKQLRQLKTEGAKIVLGEPTVPATVAPATTTTSAPKNVLALDAPKTATVAPATAEAPANKPMTWERYAQEHGKVYKKPTSGAVAADKIAEKQIKINNLNKDIKRLQSIVAENPNLQTLIDGKRAEVANLENEVKQIKSGLQTPKVKTPVVEPKVESMGTSYKVGDATPEGFRALVEDAPANTPAPEAHVNTPEALASETQKGNAPVHTPEAQAPEVPKDKVKVKETRAERLRNNPELAERYERFSKVAKKSAKMKGLKKLGKWGAVAALAIGAGALLFKACSSDEKATPVPAEKPEDKVKTKPEETAPVAPVEQPEQPEQPVATENIIQNGDSLEEVANRYGVTVEQLKELNADKVKQFRTADGKIVDGFIVGEDITLPDDVKKVEGLRTKDESIADYEEYLVKNFDKIPQSMWNQVCTPEFRRKHKLGEYKEAA